MAQHFSTAIELRERGVYTAIVNGTEYYWIHADNVLYIPDEWVDGAPADWDIDSSGRLCFQGDAVRGGGLAAIDLDDTGFTADGDEITGQIGVAPSLGTDWPIVAVLLRDDNGAWWLDQIVNGGRTQCGEGGTFDETIAWAQAEDDVASGSN